MKNHLAGMFLRTLGPMVGLWGRGKRVGKKKFFFDGGIPCNFFFYLGGYFGLIKL